MSDRTSPRRTQATGERKFHKVALKHLQCSHSETRWTYQGYVAYKRCLICGRILREEER